MKRFSKPAPMPIANLAGMQAHRAVFCACGTSNQSVAPVDRVWSGYTCYGCGARFTPAQVAEAGRSGLRVQAAAREA
jgi:hypothetical protein